jgi:hypothetical protein
MTAGSTERTSGYFGDQTPSASKKPRFSFRVSRAPHFRNPYLTKVINQRGTTLELLKLQFPFSTIILNL